MREIQLGLILTFLKVRLPPQIAVTYVQFPVSFFITHTKVLVPPHHDGFHRVRKEGPWCVK
jgi:hypothetical protein